MLLSFHIVVVVYLFFLTYFRSLGNRHLKRVNVLIGLEAVATLDSAAVANQVALVEDARVSIVVVLPELDANAIVLNVAANLVHSGGILSIAADFAAIDGESILEGHPHSILHEGATPHVKALKTHPRCVQQQPEDARSHHHYEHQACHHLYLSGSST